MLIGGIALLGVGIWVGYVLSQHIVWGVESVALRDETWFKARSKVELEALDKSFPWAMTGDNSDLVPGFSFWQQPTAVTTKVLLGQVLSSWADTKLGVSWINAPSPLIVLPMSDSRSAINLQEKFKTIYQAKATDNRNVWEMEKWFVSRHGNLLLLSIDQDLLVERMNLAGRSSSSNSFQPIQAGVNLGDNINLTGTGSVKDGQLSFDWRLASGQSMILPRCHTNNFSQLANLSPGVMLTGCDFPASLKWLDNLLQKGSLESGFSKVGLDFSKSFLVQLRKEYAVLFFSAFQDKINTPVVVLVFDVTDIDQKVSASLTAWQNQISLLSSRFPVIQEIKLPDGTTSFELTITDGLPYSWKTTAQSGVKKAELEVPFTTKQKLPFLGVNYVLADKYLVFSNNTTATEQTISLLNKLSATRPVLTETPYRLLVKNARRTLEGLNQAIGWLGWVLPESLLETTEQSWQIEATDINGVVGKAVIR